MFPDSTLVREPARRKLIDQFLTTRFLTEQLCEPLETEDYVVQTIEDVSPPKWHAGHTTWFYERLILQEFIPDYRPFDERLYFVFNSYYESLGVRIQRNLRGTLSRPTVAQVTEYRKVITERMVRFLAEAPVDTLPRISALTTLGINHEQQHQELLITDIKHIFASNPLRPVYRERDPLGTIGTSSPHEFIPVRGGIVEIGAADGGFSYDNETPRHKIYLPDFRLGSRPITNREYLEFINDRGYSDHHLWLSDGWDTLKREGWRAPLYWEETSDGWMQMTLAGLRPVHPDEPVTHVSFYEAAAFARWAGCRLPTEAEWEIAATQAAEPDGNPDARRKEVSGVFVEDSLFHPQPTQAHQRVFASLFGNVWEWTQSAYLPYPGYVQTRDALGEYNGKFMNNQRVLRGGSCATPRDHIRASYRNFFQPEKRWQFTGIRLAQET